MLKLARAYQDFSPGAAQAADGGTDVRERIVANVVTTLQGIVPANGATITMAKVTRRWEPGQVAKVFPTVVVVEGTETKQQLGGGEGGYDQCSLQVALHVWTRDSAPATEVNQVLSEIHRFLRVDRSRGGLAVNTDLPGNTKAVSPQSLNPLGFMELVMNINYRHRAGDPTVAV